MTLFTLKMQDTKTDSLKNKWKKLKAGNNNDKKQAGTNLKN